MTDGPSIHGTVVLIGARAVLLRGPSGAGKSRLAWTLVRGTTQAGFRRLVADDRVLLTRHGDALIARPPATLAGGLELWGEGIIEVPHEPRARVGLIVDLVPDCERMPAEGARSRTIEGVVLPRIAVLCGHLEEAAGRVLHSAQRLWGPQPSTSSRGADGNQEAAGLHGGAHTVKVGRRSA